jgi:hypothetical protein
MPSRCVSIGLEQPAQRTRELLAPAEEVQHPDVLQDLLA